MSIVFITEHMGCFGNLKKRSQAPTAIVIHHTCTASPAKTRRALMKKGFSTHFEVDTDGKIYQYADEMRICSHCRGANIYTIGVDITHLSKAEFPEIQVDAVCKLVDYLCEKWKIERVVNEERKQLLRGIFPHRALCNTACPQNFPMERISEHFKEKYKEKIEGLCGLGSREAGV